jgi:hypothetical protein
MVETHTLSFTDCTPDADGNSAERTSFVCEENKKSSFILSNIVVLKVRTMAREDDEVATGGDGTSRTISSAAISYSIDKENHNEIFLFGGFELLSNVNSLQVCVTRDELKGEEYLTSCKGVRARDLPHIENEEQMILVDDLNTVDWFKFVFASPGGAKPVFCVRLVFHVPPTNDIAPPVFVRTMKAKCRLNNVDAKPAVAAHHSHNTHHLQGMQHLQQPTAGDMSNLASMMSMMQNTRAMSHSISTPQYGINHASNSSAENMTNLLSMMAMTNNTNKSAAAMQNQTDPALQTNTINFLQQQRAQQSLEKNHAEMMSSIAGLGMYLKSSKEKTMISLESMLSQMESRLSQKLDVLSCRIDAIEQQLSCAKLNQMTDVELIIGGNAKQSESSIIRERQSSEQSTHDGTSD